MLAHYRLDERNEVDNMCGKICELFIFYFILGYLSWYLTGCF
jgi:hypothetical protein